MLVIGVRVRVRLWLSRIKFIYIRAISYLALSVRAFTEFFIEV